MFVWLEKILSLCTWEYSSAKLVGNNVLYLHEIIEKYLRSISILNQ